VLTSNTTPKFIPIRERVFGAPGPLARRLNSNPLLTNVTLNWEMYAGVLYNACNRFGVDRVVEEIRHISRLTHVENKGAYLREAFSRWEREAKENACPSPPVLATMDAPPVTATMATKPKEAAINAPKPPHSLSLNHLQPHNGGAHWGADNPFRLKFSAKNGAGFYRPQPIHPTRAP